MAEAALAERITIGEAVAMGRERLRAAGCDTPRLDAELLLAEVLGVGRERLVLDRTDRLTAPDRERYEGLLERRVAREPVAYILGRRAFRRLTLASDARALVPRPETELLVEVALELAAGSTVIDVGTGSGAVALAVADERPDLHVTGVDIDPGALALARENAARLGLSVTFTLGDLLPDGVAADAVLANLPYVAEGTSLPPEVARWEPHEALFSGPDGLDTIRRLIASVGAARERGAGPSLLALEIGPDQAATVAGLAAAAGFGDVTRVRDLAGHERIVVARP